VSAAQASSPQAFSATLADATQVQGYWRREWDELGPSLGLAPRWLGAASPSARASLRSRRTRVGSHPLSLMQRKCKGIGGESGIRTHGGRKTTPVFKTGALNRSAISPY
jgi:hypothetical protein